MKLRRAVVLTGLSSSVFAMAAAIVSCLGDDPVTTSVGADSAVADAPGNTGEGGGAEGGASDAADAADAAAVCDASPCVVQISAGGAHTCARMLDGTVRCWGNNAFGESGGGAVSPPDGGNDEIVTPMTYTTPHIVAGFPAATVIGAGGAYRSNGISCAATSDTKMYCWGIDKSQQLGRGGTAKVGDVTMPVPARPVPAAVTLLKNVRDVSVGVRHACAVFEGGAVACWGGDLFGALGFAPAGMTYGIPQTLQTATTFDRVVSRGQHNLALSAAGKVWSWGDNGDGQHGTAASGTPGPVEEIASLTGTYLDIAAGRFHGCALDMTGKVWCWGKDGDGQLGRGTPTGSTHIPATVAFVAGTMVKQISGDEQHMVALASDGSVYEWGTLINGSGVPSDPRGTTLDAPTQVTLPKRATQVTAGFEHSCALLEGGAVWCWGNDRNGELGRGTTAGGIQLTPAPVVF